MEERRGLRWMVALIVLGAGAAGCSGGDSPSEARPEFGVVAGKVGLADGTAVPGAGLALARVGSPGQTRQTGADGRYRFDDVAAGTWTLSLEVPAGYELGAAPGQATVQVRGGETATRDFAVSKAGVGGGVRVVQLVGTSFSPASLQIAPGTTVRWVNTSDMLHTVTPDGHTEWTRWETTGSGQSFEHTFNTPGTYAYFCEPHRGLGMTGVVTVQ